MKATTLEEAVNNLSLGQPLVFESFAPLPPGADPSFYEDRDRNPAARLTTLLLTSQGHDKVLLVGHLGTGKSTELNRMAANPAIQKKFVTVRINAGEVLDLNDMSYVDILFAMAAKTFAAALAAGVSLPPGLLTRLKTWRTTVEITGAHEESAEMEATASLSAWFLGAMGRLRSSHESRKEMREKMEPRVTDLIVIFNDILESLRQHPGGRDVLIIVDDTEKGTEEVSKKVFLSSGVLLSAPRCKAIFAFPVSLYASKDYRVIEQRIGKAEVLPNLHVLGHDGKRDDRAIGHLKSAVLRRLDASLLTQDALDRACMSSGGNVRELLRLLQDGAVIALTAGRGRIETDDIMEAESEIRGYYSRFLKESHFKILSEVELGQGVGSDEVSLDLLRCSAVLEYRNSDPWQGIHPLALPLLARWKKSSQAPPKRPPK